MAITIFRTINGTVIPMTVESAYKSIPRQKASKLPKFESSGLSQDYYKSVEAFTNPNAQCPVCGALVFYYEHVNGSKVYFEELGPPWTKHPCTDNTQYLAKAPKLFKQVELKKNSHNKPLAKANWHLDGWRPAKVKFVKEVDAGVGIPKSSEVTLSFYGVDRDVKCTLKHGALRKLKLNKNSLKKALIQCKINTESDGAMLSIHSGISNVEINGKVLQKTTNHRLFHFHLSNIQVQVPNKDGNLTLLFATINMEQVLFVFDMNNYVQSSALDSILSAKTANLSIDCIHQKPRYGNSVTLNLNKEPLLELTLHHARDASRFLSPSQKAEKISERKQKFGGNSAFADAFAKALKKT